MSSADSRQESFGVYKPVGHVVMSFAPGADVSGAVNALTQAGFASGAVRQYSPTQMKAQAELDIADASPLASIGQELNLVKAHRDLAERGYSFLVVHAPDDAQTEQVAAVGGQFHASRAQKYGRFIIEELLEPGDGTNQVSESPDRGLNAQTKSGEEGDGDAVR